jgi:hypothetical protein
MALFVRIKGSISDVLAEVERHTREHFFTPDIFVQELMVQTGFDMSTVNTIVRQTAWQQQGNNC